MANVADYYTLYLKVNGSEEVLISSTSFSISVKDSIYSLSPEITLTIDDIYGFYTGYRLGGYGNEWSFRLIIRGETYNYEYRSERYDISSFENSGMGLSGTLTIHMYHKIMYLPSEVKAYQGKSPDKIVSDLANILQIKKVKNDASSMLDMTYIYNPGYTPYEFIDKILLPLSSSTTDFIPNPFYAFIDAQNTLNYISLKTLWNASPVTKVLYYGNKINVDSEKETKVLYFAPFSHNYTHLDPAIDSSMCRIENQNGEFISVETGMNKLLAKQNLMFYKREKSVKLNMASDHFRDSNGAMKDQAGLNYALRKSYLTDKAICSLPLDLAYCAGKKVKVTCEFNISGNEEVETYSQYYIIESSVHEWDSSTFTGTTKLVLGNPVPYGNGTVMQSGLYQG